MVASLTTMLAKQDATWNQYTDLLVPGNFIIMHLSMCNQYVEYLKDSGYIPDFHC